MQDYDLARKNLIAALHCGLINWFEYFSEWCRLVKLEQQQESEQNANN